MIKDEDKCPRCQGKLIMAYERSYAKCTACSGSGLNYKARKARAEHNRAMKERQTQKDQDRIEEVEAALDQFEPKTNLDYVLKAYVEDSPRTDRIRKGIFKRKDKNV